MLEDRPIIQRSLIGFGAFAFVFGAAMAGTAFMISGGFELGGVRHRTAAAPDYATVTQTAFDQWAPDASAATPVYVTPAPTPAEAQPSPDVAPASYTNDDSLEGETADASRPQEDHFRYIERELARLQQEQASSPQAQDDSPYRDDYRVPQPSDEEIIAQKERAEAGYGPY